MENPPDFRYLPTSYPKQGIVFGAFAGIAEKTVGALTKFLFPQLNR